MREGPLAGAPVREPVGKRASVRRRSAGAAISLGPPSPAASCGLPGNPGPLARTRSGGPPESVPCLALLRTGFTEPRRSPVALVGSYPTFPPLPAPPTEPGVSLGSRLRPLAVCFCGTFPGSPRVGVTHRPALRRPDFPRCALSSAPRPPNRLAGSVYSSPTGTPEGRPTHPGSSSDPCRGPPTSGIPCSAIHASKASLTSASACVLRSRGTCSYSTRVNDRATRRTRS